MGKKLLIAAVVVLALGVVNLTLLLIAQSRRAAALEQHIAQLQDQLAGNQSPASTPGLSPMEEIHRAIECGDLPQLRTLLDAHPDLLNATTHNRFGSSPLQLENRMSRKNATKSGMYGRAAGPAMPRPKSLRNS